METLEYKNQLPLQDPTIGLGIDQYVEVEFIDLGLDDELFDFDDALEEAISKPDSADVMLALDASLERVAMSGDIDKLIYASGQLAAAACTHDHLESVAGRAMEELFGGHNDHDGHDHAEHNKDIKKCAKHKDPSCTKCDKKKS